MTDNYSKIVRAIHAKLFDNVPAGLADHLPAKNVNQEFTFKAFGTQCKINSQGFFLDNHLQDGVPGILLSLYALNAHPGQCILEPFKAYKEFPDTMPYVGAFATHTENVLLPHVKAIKENLKAIASGLDGYVPDKPASGDFSFIVYPLPKLALCYIFYEEDDDFPPSVTCLYSNNASLFMPNDALADVGEYTSKKIIALVQKG
jgi:hypothetical protein